MEKRSDDGVTDIKVQESTNSEHGRSSPEKDLGAFQINEAQEEWNLVDDNYLPREDEGEWSVDYSKIAAEEKRSPKSSTKLKLTSSISSSSMAGFRSSNYQKKQTEGHFGQLR